MPMVQSTLFDGIPVSLSDTRKNRRVAARQQYAQNVEKERARARAYNARNREKQRARYRAYNARPDVKARRKQELRIPLQGSRARDREIRRKWRKYGISQAIWQRILHEQGGCCAICGVSFETACPNIDHDHATGRVRGVLCRHCNTGIGHLRDDEQRLRAAVRYLAQARDSVVG
jgi:hypothetical protein